MTRRLQRARSNVRLRLAQGVHGPILRALVSPSYSAIEDSSLLAAVVDTLEQANPLLHRLEMTQRMTNIVITIGEPQSRGGIVGTVWGALTITNSGVGWSGLFGNFVSHSVGLKNGMSAPIYEGQLIKVRHRALSVGAIRDLLQTKIQTIPEVLLRATRTLEASTSWSVVNVEAEARELLRERGLIRTHLGGVLAAYKREPHQSVFGVAQAITLHAHEVSPDDRLGLERLAGSYVLRSAP